MMKKYMNNKGFTLVELMMVIAIIGILALVLIPKMSFMKNTAKESGLDTNIRIVEATATGLINKYDSNQKSAFNSALKQKLEAQVVNPFSKNSTCNTGTTTLYTTQGGVYLVSDSAISTWTQPNTNAKGTVYCESYVSGGGLYLKINGVDGNGNWYRTTDTIVE